MTIPETNAGFQRKPSLVEQVLHDLEAKIRSGVYRAGTKLPTEPEVMAAHCVSRTVVREAMSRLQAAGLAETRHGVGSFVLPLPAEGPQLDSVTITTLRDLLAMLELRISVETEAAGLAAQRRSDEQIAQMRLVLKEYADEVSSGKDSIGPDFRFHLLIAQATGNKYFESVYRQLGTTTIPRQRLNVSRLSGLASAQSHLEQWNREHESILEAIARKDSEGARAAMRIHLSNSRERLRQAIDVAEDVNISRHTS